MGVLDHGTSELGGITIRFFGCLFRSVSLSKDSMSKGQHSCLQMRSKLRYSGIYGPHQSVGFLWVYQFVFGTSWSSLLCTRSPAIFYLGNICTSDSRICQLCMRCLFRPIEALELYQEEIYNNMLFGISSIDRARCNLVYHLQHRCLHSSETS